MRCKIEIPTEGAIYSFFLRRKFLAMRAGDCSIEAICARMSGDHCIERVSGEESRRYFSWHIILKSRRQATSFASNQ